MVMLVYMDDVIGMVYMIIIMVMMVVIKVDLIMCNSIIIKGFKNLSWDYC